MFVVISQNSKNQYATAIEVDGRKVNRDFDAKKIISLAEEHLRKINKLPHSSIKYAKGEYNIFLTKRHGNLLETKRISFQFNG